MTKLGKSNKKSSAKSWLRNTLFMIKKFRFFLQISIGVILLGMLGFFIIQQPFSFNSQQKVSPAPTITPIYMPQKNQTDEQAPRIVKQKLVAYNFEQNKLQELSEFSMKMGDYFGTPIPTIKGDALYIADAYIVTKFSLADNMSQIIYSNKTTDRHIQSVSIDDTGYFYVGLSPDDYYAKGSYFILNVVTASTGVTSRTLSPLDHVLYGGINYLFKTGDYDIVASIGGDGCGGGGDISRFKDGKAELITNTGSGCAESPRYLGFLSSKNQLLMASIIPGSWEMTDTKTTVKYDVLYGHNVLTDEKEPIYDLKQIPDLDTLLLSSDKKIVLLISPETISVFDLDNRSITKKINFAGNTQVRYDLRIVGNEIININYIDKTLDLSLINLQTDEIKTHTNVPINNSSAVFVGKWKDLYLFLLPEY